MFFAGNMGPIIEKDPIIQQLRQNVANQMWDIIKDQDVVVQKDEIQFVSFEDALKELVTQKIP
jgi:hypothetical protein